MLLKNDCRLFPVPMRSILNVRARTVRQLRESTCQMWHNRRRAMRRQFTLIPAPSTAASAMTPSTSTAAETCHRRRRRQRHQHHQQWWRQHDNLTGNGTKKITGAKATAPATSSSASRQRHPHRRRSAQAVVAKHDVGGRRHESGRIGPITDYSDLTFPNGMVPIVD